MDQHEAWHLSTTAAERYDRYVARYILGPWAPLLVDAARVAMGERVLDIACGTGVVTRVAAERVGPAGHVIGLDLNPAMIAVAQSRPISHGVRIEWLEGSALDLPLDDATVAIVLCQQGLQFFPDKALALREMRRVLADGGRLALSVWNSVGVYNGAVGDALTRYLGHEVALQFCASRRAPGKEELQRLALEAGFTAVHVGVRQLNVRLPRLDIFALDHLAATPVASRIAAADAETRRNIGASVCTELQLMATHQGECFCGAVKIEVTGDPQAMGYCHCRSCRSWSGGPVNAFSLWRPEDVKVTAGTEHVATFAKTPMSERQYCKKCGGHLMANHPPHFLQYWRSLMGVLANVATYAPAVTFTSSGFQREKALTGPPEQEQA